VVEPRHKDVVACLQISRQPTRDVQGRRGHVVAKDDLLGTVQAWELLPDDVRVEEQNWLL